MRKRDEEKLQNIKKAVMKLILQEGFHGTSIAKIAKEAGVSPATVYIYYGNKDDMLREIYKEYGNYAYTYMLSKISPDMGGTELISTLVKAYRDYIKEYSEPFYFVEQFSTCPALVSNCSDLEGCLQMSQWFIKLKERNIIKNIDNQVIRALIFPPVKSIVLDSGKEGEELESALDELIKIIQEALLV